MEAVLLSPTKPSVQDNHESNFLLEDDPTFPALISQRTASPTSHDNEEDTHMDSDPDFPTLPAAKHFQSNNRDTAADTFQEDPSFPSLSDRQPRRDNDSEPPFQNDPSFPTLLEKKLSLSDNINIDNDTDTFQDDPSFPALSKIPHTQDKNTSTPVENKPSFSTLLEKNFSFSDNTDVDVITLQDDPSFPTLSKEHHLQVNHAGTEFQSDPSFPDLSSQQHSAVSIINDKNTISLLEHESYFQKISQDFPRLPEIVPSVPRIADEAPFMAKTFSGKPINIYRKVPKISRQTNNAQTSEYSRRSAILSTEKPIWKIIAEHEERKKQKEQAAQNTPSTLPLPNNSVPIETELLSDIYKPKNFIHLMGDERVNRSAMGWIKEWDQCVFRRFSMKRKRQREAMLSEMEVIPNKDPLGRPEEKILLLSGPPGLGKTTMAHVIATQSGYQVLEINASDERSSHIVTTKIREAVESDQISMTGLSTNKPICVVIDEIDGSTGGDHGFIRSLIQLVEQGGSVRQTNAKSKKKEYRPLSRPIICICNDLYAPALRPLRPYCKIVRVRTVPVNHIVKRMKEICESEKIPCDAKGLTLLVEIAEGDFRTCLNTLQFIKSKGGRIDEKTLKSSDITGKDSGTTPASVWRRLLKPTAKESNGDRYTERLARDVATCGEYDRLAQGCFENYLTLKPPNDPFRAIGKGLRWLNAFDVLDTRLKADKNFELYGYLPYTFVGWNPLFANVANKSIEWPKTDYENYLKQTAHTEIANEFAQRIPADTKKLFSSSAIATEMIPLMLRVLSPNLRSVNNEIVKANEKALLAKVVNIMSSLGVQFVQDKNEEGQSLYRIDPSIDAFGHYDGKLAPDLTKSRFSVRQLIAKELARSMVKKTRLSNTDGPEETVNLDMQKDNDQCDGPAVDFFGRPITISNNDEENPRPAKRLRVLYKYHEGFSNAVKVPMKISNLFG